MTVRAGPFLALLLLAGCSSSDDGQTSGEPTTTTPSPGAADVPVEELPDVEILNTTITFGQSATFRIPDGYPQFSVAYRILSQCPGGTWTAPRFVLVDPDGEDAASSTPQTFQETTPEPYTCSANDMVGQRPYGEIGSATWSGNAAQPGQWTLETRGQMSGQVEVVVVAIDTGASASPA